MPYINSNLSDFDIFQDGFDPSQMESMQSLPINVTKLRKYVVPMTI